MYLVGHPWQHGPSWNVGLYSMTVGHFSGWLWGRSACVSNLETEGVALAVGIPNQFHLGQICQIVFDELCLKKQMCLIWLHKSWWTLTKPEFSGAVFPEPWPTSIFMFFWLAVGEISLCFQSGDRGCTWRARQSKFQGKIKDFFYLLGVLRVVCWKPFVCIYQNNWSHWNHYQCLLLISFCGEKCLCLCVLWCKLMSLKAQTWWWFGIRKKTTGFGLHFINFFGTKR